MGNLFSAYLTLCFEGSLAGHHISPFSSPPLYFPLSLYLHLDTELSSSILLYSETRLLLSICPSLSLNIYFSLSLLLFLSHFLSLSPSLYNTSKPYIYLFISQSLAFSIYLSLPYISNPHPPVSHSLISYWKNNTRLLVMEQNYLHDLKVFLGLCLDPSKWMHSSFEAHFSINIFFTHEKSFTKWPITRPHICIVQIYAKINYYFLINLSTLFDVPIAHQYVIAII